MVFPGLVTIETWRGHKTALFISYARNEVYRVKIGVILAERAVLEARRQNSQKDKEAEAQVNMVLVGIQANVRKSPAVRVAVALTQLNNLGLGSSAGIYTEA